MIIVNYSSINNGRSGGNHERKALLNFAILYALAFLLIPVQTSLFFSGFAEARAVLYLRFCGAAVLAWGLIV